MNFKTRFTNDINGNVAIIFALTIIPVLLTAGLAIDGARGYYLSSKSASVLDAAALAAAKALQKDDLTDDEVKSVAHKWISAHMANEVGKDINVMAINVTVDRNAQTVETAMTAKVATRIGPIIGVDHFNVERSAAAAYGIRPVELGLMLDVSGSMRDFGKIGDLKAAVKSLVDILVPADDRPEHVRIGIAPYATSVNAGPYASKAKSEKGKCVSERRGKAAYTDDSARSIPMGGKAVMCPTSEVLAMTNSRPSLLASIDDLSANGATAGHLGIAWAWYLVSPKWADIWPDESRPKEYGEKGVIKSVVLMTDGMFNTEYEADNGKSSEQALALCASIKKAGVLVFTVGFQAPPEVLPILKSCATDSKHFYDAQDPANLTQAFKDIAQQLTELRLTR